MRACLTHCPSGQARVHEITRMPETADYPTYTTALVKSSRNNLTRQRHLLSVLSCQGIVARGFKNSFMQPLHYITRRDQCTASELAPTNSHESVQTCGKLVDEVHVRLHTQASKIHHRLPLQTHRHVLLMVLLNKTGFAARGRPPGAHPSGCTDTVTQC